MLRNLMTRLTVRPSSWRRRSASTSRRRCRRFLSVSRLVLLWQPPDGRRHSVVARIYILNGERARRGQPTRRPRASRAIHFQTGRTDNAKCPILRLIGHCTAPVPTKRVTQCDVTDRCYEEEREAESPNSNSIVQSRQFFLRPESRSSFAVITLISGVCLVRGNLTTLTMQ